MDKIKKRPLPTITEEERQQAIANAETAKKLLKDPEFKFFRDILVSEKEKIIDNAVNNRLKKTIIKKENHEVVYERWEQEAEESGKFKFIFELINRLEAIKNYPSQIEEAIEKGQLKVEE